ncbi:unnamed protein product [Prorocentrum cordatum]|uniref:Uncharacterized protein n=1 Tax=Prorocentrum cordatum TaxID=2364126 RepID=A0ABN9STC2_9DINO|nr:unnamed protein product [Polarella glacialis]
MWNGEEGEEGEEDGEDRGSISTSISIPPTGEEDAAPAPREASARAPHLRPPSPPRRGVGRGSGGAPAQRRRAAQRRLLAASRLLLLSDHSLKKASNFKSFCSNDADFGASSSLSSFSPGCLLGRPGLFMVGQWPPARPGLIQPHVRG